MAGETKHATVAWRRGMEFEGGPPGGPMTLVDGHAAAAPSPVVMLLIAVAGCTGSDVVSILEKMRVTLESFRIEIAGVRREHEPKRYVSIHLVYHIRAQGLDEAKARRAIGLSLEKYCSVTQSLAPDIAVTYDVALD